MIKKIRVKTRSGDCKVITVGKNIYLKKLLKERSYSISKNTIHTNDYPLIVFLKINRFDDYAFRCLQHWLDIVHLLSVPYFIVVDNKFLQYAILDRCVFPDENFLFLDSKNSFNSKISLLLTKCWWGAGNAHLATFLKAQELNCTKFWNIDADDTMICAEPIVVANMLREAQNYADKNKIQAFSLDMWNSRTSNIHWSFGISYHHVDFDIKKIIAENINGKWKANYLAYADAFNIDWFFTYLRDEGLLKIKTWYFENVYFIHFGNFLLNPIPSTVCFWSNREVFFPILDTVFNRNDMSRLLVSPDNVEIKIDSTLKHSREYLFKNLCLQFDDKTKKLWGIN